MTDNTVEISTGKLRGTYTQGIHAYKGIPYGGPTGGKNRFQPPVPVESWAGVKEANGYGQACWQPADISPQSYTFMGAVGLSLMGEDCLVLNVWSPGLNDNRKRPVMVWLHGGGFFVGSGDHLPCFDGASLAKSGDVVVVSLNHRLGVFGYLYLDEIAGDRYKGSGNAGMLDIVQALKWVRDNITVFGGDPGNVTVFGQSGGGAKVTALLAMPAAKGLIHRAVSQSGPGMKERPAEGATQVARQYLGAFGLKPNQLERLHEMRTDMVYSGWAAMTPSVGMPFGHFAPVVDGKVLPVQPFDPVAAPTAADVPLMIGTNKDEVLFMLMRQPELKTCDENLMRKTLIERSRFEPGGINAPLERIDDLISVYRRTRPQASPFDRLIAMLTDQKRAAAISVAERKTAAGHAPAYMYMFTWESPFLGGAVKSCHGLELPFVFNNVEPTGMIGNGPERFKLAEKISATWISFARNGNPNHKGIPNWPAYESGKRATMMLNLQCQMQEDPHPEERKIWEEIG